MEQEPESDRVVSIIAAPRGAWTAHYAADGDIMSAEVVIFALMSGGDVRPISVDGAGKILGVTEPGFLGLTPAMEPTEAIRAAAALVAE